MRRCFLNNDFQQLKKEKKIDGSATILALEVPKKRSFNYVLSLVT